MTLPRLEMQAMLRRIAFSAVPHLPRELQAAWLARKISAESGRPVSAGTVTRWWNARHDDDGGVDSRHMDWARSHDPKRSAAANDNALRRYSPCSAEAMRAAA